MCVCVCVCALYTECHTGFDIVCLVSSLSPPVHFSLSSSLPSSTAAVTSSTSPQSPAPAAAPAACSTPSLPELLRLKVPQQVGANYSTFGIFLLNDQTGSRVNAIDDEFRGKSDKIILRILQEWLEGKGLPVMWESLVQTLRDIDLSVLADQIQTSKMPAI